MSLVKKTLIHEELSNKVENLAASLTGMLIDYTVHGVRDKTSFSERAGAVVSILVEIDHVYSREQLPFAGALIRCAHYFGGWDSYARGAAFFRGSRYHEGDVTTALKKYKSPYLGGFEYDHPVKTVSMQPGQDFLDERAQQFADAKGLGLMRFGRVSVMRSKETGSGGGEIILTRWAAIESPEKYRHFVAGVAVSQPLEVKNEIEHRMRGVVKAQKLTGELAQSLDVSGLISRPLLESDLR